MFLRVDKTRSLYRLERGEDDKQANPIAKEWGRILLSIPAAADSV